MNDNLTGVELDPRLRQKETLRLLEEGRAIIGDPAHWTQGCSARNRRGVIVAPWAHTAVSFCSTGVLSHVGQGWTDEVNDAILLLGVEANSQFGYPIVECNDTMPHDQVLAIWDATIANYRKELES